MSKQVVTVLFLHTSDLHTKNNETSKTFFLTLHDKKRSHRLSLIESIVIDASSLTETVFADQEDTALSTHQKILRIFL